MTTHTDKPLTVAEILDLKPRRRIGTELISENHRRLRAGEFTPEFVDSLEPVLGRCPLKLFWTRYDVYDIYEATERGDDVYVMHHFIDRLLHAWLLLGQPSVEDLTKKVDADPFVFFA